MTRFRYAEFMSLDWGTVASRRSMTPPRGFARAGLDARDGGMTEMPRMIGDRIVARIGELDDAALRLSQINACGVAKTMDDAIKSLAAEKAVVAAVHGESSVLNTKYTKSFTAYERYLASRSASTPLHYRERYIISDTAPFVLHYAINALEITAETTGEKETVLGIGHDLIAVVDAGSKKSTSSGGGTKAIKLLHPLELEIFKNAVDKLLEVDGPRAVVIDIFDKNDTTGAIKLDGHNHPETHAVVLCKQIINGNVQIFVIDPSNSSFSKHLDHPVLKALVSLGVRWVDVITSTKPIKIYSVPEGAETGPFPHQFRDCVDIAVKVANGLNVMYIPPEPTFPKITFAEKVEDGISVWLLKIIQSVSNQLGTAYVPAHQDFPIRSRQSSNLIAVKEIHRLESKLRELKTEAQMKIDAKRYRELDERHIKCLERHFRAPSTAAEELVLALKTEINFILSEVLVFKAEDVHSAERIA